ncbi:MAG TPA: PQQ-binding-like beta-propeller repeat protein, partial [Planctomycetia bacterium]|nr:PQQ-binding-like beta-propeller repeat protein [Planctomycetia bacterium]
LIVGDVIYASQSEENPESNSMGMLAAIKGNGVGDVTQSLAIWKTRGAMIGRATPVMVDGKLVAVDDGAGYYVYNPDTGKQLYSKKLGTAQRASPLYADGKIYTVDMNGRWNVLKPKPDGSVDVIHRLRLPGECHSSPIVSHGRIYVQSLDTLFCIAKKGATPAADPIPAPPVEPKAADDAEPATVLVVPAEALVRPGEKIAFEARVYDAAGRRLKDRPAVFSVKGNGAAESNGQFTAGAKPHSAAMVTATVGGLKAEARVRVIPDLPWSFDFADGEIPVTWVGMRYRHVIRKNGDDPFMVKITTIPKGQRSQAWIGHPDFHDYTMQAEFKGARTNDKLPDMGLIAQRYTFDLMGQAQQLQIRTWTASTRRAVANVPFKWKEGVWYVMKFRAANEGPKAVLRGKVWPKGETEPEAWNLELADDAPNRNGSPGFYGNAQNSEISIDNVKVFANQ